MLGFWITQSNKVRLFDEKLTGNYSQFDTAQAAFNARPIAILLTKAQIFNNPTKTS